jgi:hypothetical protein
VGKTTGEKIEGQLVKVARFLGSNKEDHVFIFLRIAFTSNFLFPHQHIVIRWKNFFKGFIFIFFMYDIQHCFICRPSDSTVPEDAGIEPRTVSTTALTLYPSIKLCGFLDLVCFSF